MRTLGAGLGVASGLVPDGGVHHTTHIILITHIPPIMTSRR